jgi:hypothetical protein
MVEKRMIVETNTERYLQMACIKGIIQYNTIYQDNSV